MGSSGRRFLFAVRPGAGHVNRVHGVAVELAARGHEVAWLAPRDEMSRFLDPDARLFNLTSPPPDERPGGRQNRPLMLDLGLSALPAAEDAVAGFRPDAMVIDRMVRATDQLTIGSTLAARRRGLPWATVTSGGGAPAREDFRPADVAPGITKALAEIQRAAGVEPLPWPLTSPQLVLVFSTPELLGRDSFPAHYRLVGPALEARVEDAPFPWDELGERPRVLVTLGTVYASRGGRFLGAVADGLAGSHVQVVLVAPPELDVEARDNVLVRPYVPQLALLSHIDAVVTLGGHNTVCEALSHGLPLVVAPFIDDQVVHAHQVAEAGAGIAVDFHTVTPGELREAVLAVLSEPAYRRAAERIKASFERAGGTAAAADALEDLAASPES